MTVRLRWARVTLALIALMGMSGVLHLSVPLVGAQTASKPGTTQAPAKPPTTQTPAKPATPSTAKPAATAPAPEPEIDGGWPRDAVTASGGTVRLFQPQVATWQEQRHMVAYSASSFVAKGATKPALGTFKIEADTSVALNDRLVNFTSLRLTEVTFPGLPNDQLKEVVSTVEQSVPAGALVLALDRVLARLDKSQLIPKNVEGVKADPPVIFYSNTPAVLVNLDSDPIWSPIKDNDLRFAVNTNWDLFEHGPSKTFYLRNNDHWLSATDVQGPWKAAGKLPPAFSSLPADENWKEVKAAVPGRTVKSVPQVFVSTKPAEMILLQGAPNYLTVSGTKALLWVSNTESDVFRLGKTGPVYFLTSGRWFVAPDFTGPWAFTTPNLPDDFKKIPLSHARSRVLASVPGTDEAAEAVLLAQIPQTARVSKKQVKAPEVEYQGTPIFEMVPQTSVSRAVNTDKDIIKFGDLYYMCFQGVWFVSKGAQGPWEVTGTVPKEIYEIPPSSPAYNVTNVTIVEDDDDEVVFATAAAYTGMMVAWGCAVWGTGYYYPPYVWHGGYYPIYHPYYPTYGFHASYNPRTGAYSRGVTAYGPYGGAGVGARYNPRSGTYSRGAAAWGPYGARGAAEGYNPRTGTYGATRQGSGVYGSWGTTGVQRGDQWASTSRVTNRVTDTTTRTTRTSEGGGAVTRRGDQGTGGVARNADGDVYAGRDGNVYKKSEGGGWQKYDNGNGGWNNVPAASAEQKQQAQQKASDARNQAGQTRSQPTGTSSPNAVDSGTMGQLNRDSAARAEGATRTRTNSNPGASSGSYRPSGGGGARSMPRGGGGRRR